MADAMLKSKVDIILENLPPDGQEELEEFLDFLADKYHVEQTKNLIALGGIWKDIAVEITDEDVRGLREHVTEQLMATL